MSVCPVSERGRQRSPALGPGTPPLPCISGDRHPEMCSGRHRAGLSHFLPGGRPTARVLGSDRGWLELESGAGCRNVQLGQGSSSRKRKQSHPRNGLICQNYAVREEKRAADMLVGLLSS